MRARNLMKTVPKEKVSKVHTWTSEKFSKGKVADYKKFETADGEGIRCSLYVSGCTFACPKCYNKESQLFNFGFEFTKELEDEIISDLAHPGIQGLTLLGGEPFLNTGIVNPLCKRAKEERPEKDIWSWTGYTWEELMMDECSDDKKELLSYLDILVDGRFEKDMFNPDLYFRGSYNQRIIDVKRSLATGEVVLWNDGAYLLDEEHVPVPVPE